MSDSLRDQLLGLGFKPAPEPARGKQARTQPGPGRPGRPGGKPSGGRPPAGAKPRKGGDRPARTREDIDLAKAYAIRAQKEKDERIEAERRRQEQARLRREARAKLEAFLKDRVL